MKYKLLILTFLSASNNHAMELNVASSRELNDQEKEILPFVTLKKDNLKIFKKYIHKNYTRELKGLALDSFESSESAESYLSQDYAKDVKARIVADENRLRLALKQIDNLSNCSDQDEKEENFKIKKDYLYNFAFYCAGTGACYLWLYASIQKEGVLHSISKIFKFIPAVIKNAGLKLSFGGSVFMGLKCLYKAAIFDPEEGRSQLTELKK